MLPSTTLSTRHVCPVVAVWLVLGLGVAHADLTITLDDDGQTRTLYLTAQELAAKDAEGTFVFDGKNEVVSMSTPQGTRSMTKGELQAMAGMAQQYAKQSQGAGAQYGDMMAQARAQAEAAIENLPEPQRTQALNEIKKRFPDVAGATTKASAKQFEPMGRSRKIGDYDCDGYWIKLGEEEIGEMWVASLDALGIRKEDVAVIGVMRGFFAAILEGSPFMKDALEEFDTLDPDSEDFIGFPVLRVDRDGETVQETTLVSLDTGAIDRAVFETP